MLLAIIMGLAGGCCVFSMVRRTTHPELFPAHRTTPSGGARRASMAYRLLHPDEPAAPAAATAHGNTAAAPPADDDSLEDSSNALVRNAYARVHEPDLTRSMVGMMIVLNLEDPAIHRGVAEGEANTRMMFTTRSCSAQWVARVVDHRMTYPDCPERVEDTLLAGGFREVACKRGGHAEPMVFALPFVAPPPAAEAAPAEAPHAGHHGHHHH